jgi:hypothetical protein
MLAFDLITAEEIKDGQDMPNAFIKALGQPVTMQGVQVASFIGVEDGTQFLVTACRSDRGITTSHHNMTEVLEAGEGEFLNGVLELMQNHARDPLLEAKFSV